MEEAQLWLRVSSDGIAIGPFTKSQVRQLGRVGMIGGDCAIRQGESGKWHPVSAVKGLVPEGAVMRPAAAAERPVSPTSPRSSVAPVARAAEVQPTAVVEPASPAANQSARSGRVKTLALIFISIALLGGLAGGGFLLVRSGGISIPFLSPSALAVCEKASAALSEYATAMRARNTDAAADSLRAFLRQAEEICSPGFDARIKKLALEDQAKARASADEIKIVVLALGAGNDAINNIDGRIGALIMKTRSALNAANPNLLAPEERSKIAEFGMWELPTDLANGFSALARSALPGPGDQR